MTQSGAKAKGPQVQWLSLLQFIFSSLGGLLAWVLAAGSAFAGTLEWVAEGGLTQDNSSLFLSAASFFFVGLILLPSAWLALKRLSGESGEFPSRLRKFAARLQKNSMLFLFPLLVLGNYTGRSEGAAWLLFPLTHLLAASIIIIWFVSVATRKLNSGSAQRSWGAFGSGLSLSPILALGAEIFVGLFFFFFLILYLGLQPDLLLELESLVDQLAFSVNDPAVLIPALEPLLSDPVLLFMILGFVALAVPIIEELIKPIGVWLLLGRRLSPSDGFVLGVLGGAGFALFENLTIGAVSENWLFIFSARIGTTAMHIFTAGLTGWAIVTAKNEKRYWLLLGSYALSVSLHSLWNSMVVLGSFASLGMLSGASLVPSHLVFSSWLVLLVLAFGSIFLLWKSNRRLLASESVSSADIKEITPKE